MSKNTKIIYFLLFLALLLHPHFIVGHIFIFPSAYLQSFVNLMILGTAFLVYYLHNKDIKRKELEKKKIENELETSINKLNDAFRYIGLANRRLPLLKNLTTDIIKKDTKSKKDRKNIFHELSSIAITSIAKTDWGVFRFISKKTGKTVKEVIFTNKNYTLLKTQISNKQLLNIEGEEPVLEKLDDLYVMPTSDKDSDIRCYLLYPNDKKYQNDEPALLQNVVDQAQLVYSYLY